MKNKKLNFFEQILEKVFLNGNSRDTSFFGKIKYGWQLFYLSWSDWMDVMYNVEFSEEFFAYLGNRGKV